MQCPSSTRGPVSRRAVLVAGIAGIAALLGGACSSPVADSGAAPTAVTSTSSGPAPSNAPEDWEGHAETVTHQPEAVFTTDPRRTAAGRVATAALTAYARPHMREKRWHADLARYLTAQAAADYAHTDPRNVPARRVTGKPSIVATNSDRVARVHLMTDAGTYLVVLVRTSDTTHWQVSSIVPPEQGAD